VVFLNPISKMFRGVLFILLICIVGINGDVYMQNPRGSNNRLNERSAQRTNGNRLFDSQNNNRGGYNVGDKTKDAFNPSNPYSDPQATFDPSVQDATQYQMVYFEGSELPIEWTNQHACGGNEHGDPHNLNCNMILQYTCDTTDKETDPELEVILRDGGTTNTPDAPTTYAEIDTKKAQNIADFDGHQESEAYYYGCLKRSRNAGLFLADQVLKGSSQQYTRQNPNGDRRGLECPEERDYYPYWQPTIWRDIAYLTNEIGNENVDICDIVQKNSQNVKPVSKCGPLTNDAALKALTQADCEKNTTKGVWKSYTHNIPAPECKQVEWSRDNHLGNGRGSEMLNYTWTLPSFSSFGEKIKKYGANNELVKCVLRLRYNITTDDYDGYNTTSKQNHDKNAKIISPILNDPVVDIGADLQGLQLALQTDQTGRTFQDRSHVFYIKKRPASLASKKN